MSPEAESAIGRMAFGDDVHVEIAAEIRRLRGEVEDRKVAHMAMAESVGKTVAESESKPIDRCDRCDGDGKAHGADRPFEWSGPGSYPGPCPKCNGTGRQLRTIDELTAEIQRLRAVEGMILALVISDLDELPQLPKRLDEMTETERTIAHIACELTGSITCIKRWIEEAGVEPIQLNSIPLESKPVEQVHKLRELAVILFRGGCHEASHRATDAADTIVSLQTRVEELEHAQAAWQQTAEQEMRNVEFYRGLVHQIGDMFGQAARTQDDGGIVDSVLALKVPELVSQLNARVAELEMVLDSRCVELGKVHSDLLCFTTESPTDWQKQRRSELESANKSTRS